jgi:hypothetical protein
MFQVEGKTPARGEGEGKGEGEGREEGEGEEEGRDGRGREREREISVRAHNDTHPDHSGVAFQYLVKNILGQKFARHESAAPLCVHGLSACVCMYEFTWKFATHRQGGRSKNNTCTSVAY